MDDGRIAAAPRGGRRGFTLIEVLVVVAVIGLLGALLIPAVQAARETSRRVQCINNLKQIGLGIQAYADGHGSLPAGLIFTGDPRLLDFDPPCPNFVIDRGLLVEILPYIEQAALYHAINQQLPLVWYENSTIHGKIVGTYVCPSDSDSGQARVADVHAFLPHTDTIPPAFTPVARANYAGCHGSNGLMRPVQPIYGCRPDPEFVALADGTFIDVGAVTLASIRDGLSQTMFVAEKALAPLRRLDPVGAPFRPFELYGWWFLGLPGHTMMNSYYPPNAFKRSEPSQNMVPDWSESASSLHPGGVNVLMGDGSARFVKETIRTAPYPGDLFEFRVTIAGDLWRAMATRAGGEAIDPGDL